MSLSETLTHKVGPMPMGAWLVVAAGGLFIARKSQQKAATAPAPATDPTIPTGGGYGVQGGSASWDGAPVVLSPVINVRLPVQAPSAPTPAPPNVVPTPTPAPRAPVPAKPTAPAPKPAAYSSYTVRSGDSLWSIAGRLMGSSLRWPQLYAANASVIEAAARAHHYATSGGGHWIFPGTQLRVPR